MSWRDERYVYIKEPTFNCKDMDRRLRGILIRNMSAKKDIMFTSMARQALVKRAKEITPETITTLLRQMPGTLPIVESIWHVFPEETIEKFVRCRDTYGESGFHNTPSFIEDYVNLHGHALLEKYSDVPEIVMAVFSRRTNGFFTPGLSRENSHIVPPPPAQLYVQWMDRIRSLPNDVLKDSSHYDRLIDRLGAMSAAGMLNISLGDKQDPIDTLEE